MVFHMCRVNLHQLTHEGHVSVCELSEFRTACCTAGVEIGGNLTCLEFSRCIERVGVHSFNGFVEIVKRQ